MTQEKPVFSTGWMRDDGDGHYVRGRLCICQCGIEKLWDIPSCKTEAEVEDARFVFAQPLPAGHRVKVFKREFPPICLEVYENPGANRHRIIPLRCGSRWLFVYFPDLPDFDPFEVEDLREAIRDKLHGRILYVECSVKA